MTSTVVMAVFCSMVMAVPWAAPEADLHEKAEPEAGAGNGVDLASVLQAFACSATARALDSP